MILSNVKILGLDIQSKLKKNILWFECFLLKINSIFKISFLKFVTQCIWTKLVIHAPFILPSINVPTNLEVCYLNLYSIFWISTIVQILQVWQLSVPVAITLKIVLKVESWFTLSKFCWSMNPVEFYLNTQPCFYVFL